MNLELSRVFTLKAGTCLCCQGFCFSIFSLLGASFQLHSLPSPLRVKSDVFVLKGEPDCRCCICCRSLPSISNDYGYAPPVRTSAGGAAPVVIVKAVSKMTVFVQAPAVTVKAHSTVTVSVVPVVTVQTT